MKKGRVFLVGAGPGFPGLITVRGMECLRTADVILYDSLCNPFLLHQAPPRARIIFAGKHAGDRSLTQEQIERLMVKHALAGRKVVRLKGGDPFLFGRGAEEAECLARHRIPFEIVPGVTSAIAAPACAGIPVTERDLASGVAMITAHENPRKDGDALDYPALARFPGSLVVLMAVKSLHEVAGRLLAAGKPGDTPAAVISAGTRGFQKTVTGTLGMIVQRCAEACIRPPALAVIGEVVRCRDQLSWFEKLPLFGKRIVVARAREQAGSLSSKLWELGAEVLEIPLIEIQPIRSRTLREAVRKAAQWAWIVFTSPWAVRFLLDEVLRRHGDIRVLGRAKLAVVGPTTASRLAEYGLRHSLMPTRIQTEDELARHFRRHASTLGLRGCKLLLPRSSLSPGNLERVLRRLGAQVSAFPLYRNVPPNLTWELDALERIGADIVTFTSSSTAENFTRLLRKPGALSSSAQRMLRSCKHVSIGPSTSAMMRRLGMRVHAEARVQTMDGLVACLKTL